MLPPFPQAAEMYIYMCLHSSQHLPFPSYPCTVIPVRNLNTSLSPLPYVCHHTLQTLQSLQPGTRDPSLSLLKVRLGKVKPTLSQAHTPQRIHLTATLDPPMSP